MELSMGMQSDFYNQWGFEFEVEMELPSHLFIDLVKINIKPIRQSNCIQYSFLVAFAIMRISLSHTP